MQFLKQSTAATIKLGPFIDDTDGKTAKTGLTILQADIRLSKNGGDFAQTNNSAGATHDEFGYYDIPLDTTDTGTLGRLRVAVSESGALPVWQDFLVVTANVYDTLCSTDTFDVNVTTIATDAITAASLKADAVTEIQSGLATSSALATVDGIVDDILVDTSTTLDGKLNTIDTNVDSILADTGTDGVKLASTQGAITWGQQKIIANVANQGALDISNSNPTGYGQFNYGGSYGLVNGGERLAGQKNQGATKDVDGFDPALALEATLTAMKGAGWTDETLVALMTAIEAVTGGSGATAQEVWEYTTRVLTAGTNIDLSSLATAAALATVDTVVDAVKAKTDLIPASPAEAGEYTAAIAAIPTAPLLAANYTAPDNTSIAAIKAKTDNLPASPAPANEYDTELTAIQDDLDNPDQYKADVSGLATQVSVNAIPTSPLLAANYVAPDNASVGAIKAKTDLIPATPAQAGEYTAALAAVQDDLDNPDQYKADVSLLALAADLQDVEDKIDVIATDTTTEIPATLATLATSAALATVDTNVDSVLADTNEIQAELADGGRTDLLIDSIVGATTATGVLLKDTAIEAIFNDIVVTGSYTFAELMKIMASALAGELSGGGTTTLTFKSVDGASDVIEAIVDANGNRTSVTLTV